MNKSQPFKRLHNFYAAIQQVLATARVQGAEALEIQRSMLAMYRAPMGKGRGRQAHRTGHEHMAYVRRSRKLGRKKK